MSPKRKKTKALLLISGGLTAVSIYYATIPPKNPVSQEIKGIVHKLSSAIEMKKNGDYSIIKNFNESKNGNSPIEWVNRIFEKRDSIYKQAILQSFMETLVISPEALATVQFCINDPDSARLRFGKVQAKVRYYGIQALGLSAEQGNTAPLISTIRLRLDKGIDLNHFSKGEAADIQDLFNYYIIARKKELNERPEMILDELSSLKEVAPLVRKNIINAFYDQPILVKKLLNIIES